MRSEANQWLDVCRAIAIILVLLSHGRGLLLPAIPEAQLLKFGGFLGVEVFFVLSGFLIGRILIRRSSENVSSRRWVPAFWGRRWLRTYPNYLLFLLLNLLVINSWRPVVQPDLFRYLTFTQNLWHGHPSFFAEAWSLTIEEIFYFLAPLLMLCMGQRKPVKALFSAMILLLISSLILRTWVAATNPELTFNQIRSTASLRLDSIMVGVLAACAFSSCGPWLELLKRAAPSLTLLLIPVIWVAMQPDSWIDQQLSLKVLLFPMANLGCLGLIVCGLSWRINDLVYRPIKCIAKWSYSAYLINLLVLSAMDFYLPTEWKDHAVLCWFLFIGTTLGGSAIVYYSVERRILVWRDKWIK
jgi:peptidoglycan/LPS O-acetylase OafA/YrhL